MKLEELLAQTEERRVSHADHHGEIMDALMDISERLQRLGRVQRKLVMWAQTDHFVDCDEVDCDRIATLNELLNPVAEQGKE